MRSNAENKKMILSKRLTRVADMAASKGSFCDLGCDHGFLSIYLVNEKGAAGGIAADVRPGPLSAAREHILTAGLNEKIETRLSDGLKNIRAGETDTLIIAGMGGPLIIRILGEFPQVRDSFKSIVISPQSQMSDVRRGLKDQKLLIAEEDLIYEDGKYYPIIRLLPEKEADEETRIRIENREKSFDELLEGTGESRLAEGLRASYGICNILDKNPVFIQFLEYEYRLNRDIFSKLDKTAHGERAGEIEDILFINRVARKMCG